MPSVAAVQSEGDLEVLLLHESHTVLADIIGPDLYTISGQHPEQVVLFDDRKAFDYFLIRVFEFFAEGTRSSYIDEKRQNWSLLKGLQWLNERYPDEATISGLDRTVISVDEWGREEVQFQFWCPEVSSDVSFPLTNIRLLSFAANTAKHHLFRLSDLLSRLEKICSAAGYKFEPQQYPAVLDSMAAEMTNRLNHSATYLLEMLGGVFLALNRLIVRRYEQNPTNRVNDMTMPVGVTSPVFKDFYGSVLIFHRYEESRITKFTPVTSQWLKKRYTRDN